MPDWMKFSPLIATLLAIVPAVVSTADDQVTRENTKPSEKRIESEEVDYQPLAFFPDRWKREGADFRMLAWEGDRVVFLTKKGDYQRQSIRNFVLRLDQGWSVYQDITGTTPRLLKHLNQKPTICAIPKPNLSCGFGCGYVGGTGIEASAFYQKDWPEFQKNGDRFEHYYFYEMGRNFFVFGDRHSLFTTGYAVFMRYVCMDHLHCFDADLTTRRTIERCEEVYANSDIPFFDAFTNLGTGEKANRLKDQEGKPISPSDQPVMYATAMLKLRNDHGGDDWVRKFYRGLLTCQSQRATDIESAKTQCYNWLVCASAAAQKDLTPVFVDRWRMPLTGAQRDVMKEVDWKDDNLSLIDTVGRLLAEG